MHVHTEDKQVIAHLYRGEMNRLTVYRQRLDITTNWSITIMTAILVIYMDNSVEIYFVFFPLIMLLLFSFLEARRYRYFYTSANRVQMMEIGYFGKQILTLDNGHQGELIHLLHNIMNVQLLISLRDAWMIRFYRNYVWFSYICILVLIYKQLTSGSIEKAHIVFSSCLETFYIIVHVVVHYAHKDVVDM